MIELLQISGFKRFESNEFELKKITLLTGMNGAGKSSLIQGMLLAKEASLSSDTVSLDDSYGVDLGTAVEVLNWNCEDKISLELGANASWELQMTSENALYLAVTKRNVTELPFSFSRQPRVFTYLCAERVGPRTSYTLSPTPPKMLEIGVKGENTAQLIEALGNAPLPDSERVHPLTNSTDTIFLTYQIEKWISEIVRPIEIKAERAQQVKSAVLSFKTPGGEWVQATNMGFGVTYALPIILAGLLAPKGSLLIVENPEAHLHPAGQSRMGVFLGWLAEHGVQVIVETHSDHLLNGVRRSIGEYKYIDSRNAAVLFFDENAKNKVYSPLEFTEEGGIPKWPKSFFDQYKLDTAALGRIRRSRLHHVIRN